MDVLIGSRYTLHTEDMNAARWMLKALPVVALVAVALTPAHIDTVTIGGGDPTMRAIAHAQDIKVAEAKVAKQAKALGCSSQTPKAGRVAVRDADSTVVRMESFDAAWADAHAGRVWVVGYCS